MKIVDELERSADENKPLPRLFKNTNFWIIVLVVVLGILSHVFLPQSDPSLSDVGKQGKSTVQSIFKGNSEKAESNHTDSNGMNTLSGK